MMKIFSHTSKTRNSGFSVVELLVVIAIIGILIGMLLPAVQAVREAARRTACQNNMRQLGLAVLNFESGNGDLPPCGILERDIRLGGSNSNQLDFSWVIHILPFAEAGNMFDLLDFSITRNRGFDPANFAALQNAPLPMIVCPSSDMDEVVTNPAASASGVVRSFYTGIHGSVRDRDGDGNFDDDADVNSGGLGLIFDNGAFQRETQVSLAGLADGTSNTMMIGEQSNWLLDENGGLVDRRSDCASSIMLGTTSNSERIFNTTVVMYAINHQDSTDEGIEENCGRNTPLTSPHTGGINVVYGDGSVHFLTDSTNIEVLYNLCDRNDGQVIGNL